MHRSLARLESLALTGTHLGDLCTLEARDVGTGEAELSAWRNGGFSVCSITTGFDTAQSTLLYHHVGRHCSAGALKFRVLVV